MWQEPEHSTCFTLSQATDGWKVSWRSVHVYTELGAPHLWLSSWETPSFPSCSGCSILLSSDCSVDRTVNLFPFLSIHMVQDWGLPSAWKLSTNLSTNRKLPRLLSSCLSFSPPLHLPACCGSPVPDSLVCGMWSRTDGCYLWTICPIGAAQPIPGVEPH